MPGPSCLDSIVTIPPSGSNTPLQVTWAADPVLCPDFFNQCVTQWNGGPTTGHIVLQGTGGPGASADFPVSGATESYTFSFETGAQSLTDGSFILTLHDIPPGPDCATTTSFGSYTINAAALTPQQQVTAGVTAAGGQVVDSFYSHITEIVIIVFVIMFMNWALSRILGWVNDKLRGFI